MTNFEIRPSAIYWIPKFRAFVIHLAISLIFVSFAAWLVLGLWYPYPYRNLSGGTYLFAMMAGVDVVLGPLITLVIFNRTKTRSHLIIDLTVVGLIQLAALSYGLWTVFTARPVHMVFEYNRMAVVHAVDVEPSTLANAPTALQQLPLTGPTLLSLRAFKSANESFESTIVALGGLAQAAQPALWQPYEAARADILKESKKIAQLKERFPNQEKIIDNAVAETGRPADTLRYLPLLARKNAWTVVIDAETALPLGFLPLDSF